MTTTPAQEGSQVATQEHSDEVDAEAPSGVCMACLFQAGKLGIAAYDTASAEVIRLFSMCCHHMLLTGDPPCE